MRTIYLSGPIAKCTEEQTHTWRNDMTAALKGAYHISNPATTGLKGEEPKHWRDIVLKDKVEIDMCDVVVANVWKPSHGTSMEIIYAFERGKVVIAVAPNGVSPWVHEHSHYVFKNMAEATHFLLTHPYSPRHTDYALGFFFDKVSGVVAMIRKKRPMWQAGKINGIGGHCERGETILEAMVREFREETGLGTLESDWTRFSTLSGRRKDGRTYRVGCFLALGDTAVLRTMTDEEVLLMHPINYDRTTVLSNIPWLLEMAVYDSSNKHHFETIEKD